MQNIKKIIRAQFEKNPKWSILGPIFPNSQECKFSQTCFFAKMSKILASNFRQNIKKIVAAKFEKNPKRSILGPIWAQFSQNLGNRNFFGKTAVYVSRHYDTEHPCQKSRKSLERFSRKTINYY